MVADGLTEGKQRKEVIRATDFYRAVKSVLCLWHQEEEEMMLLLHSLFLILLFLIRAIASPAFPCFCI